MENPGDSPQGTRRRGRLLVLGSLVILLALAVWPLKGYRIDEREFGNSLGYPHFVAFRRGGLGALIEPAAVAETKPVLLGVRATETARNARKYDLLLRAGYVEVPGFPANALASAKHASGEFRVEFHYRNLACAVQVYQKPLPGGKTQEQLAREAMEAILDGLDRELPGVTTFYNPPARQFWFDRLKPFLDKHVPKKAAPSRPPVDGTTPPIDLRRVLERPE